MKLVLVKTKETPPDGFRFVHPETGHVSYSLDRKGWLKAIAKYRGDNQFLPITAEKAEDQLCKLLPPGWCQYESGKKPDWHVNMRLTVRDVLNGTKVLASFIFTGMPFVSKELAASRSLTCSRCYFNVPISGCSPCVGLASLTESIGGSITTPSDSSLRTCAVCHCQNKAQTRLPIELLAEGMTPDQMEKYPKDFCWKFQERMELSAAST